MEDIFGRMDLKINRKVSNKELSKIIHSISETFDFEKWEAEDCEEFIVMFSDEMDPVIFSDFNIKVIIMQDICL